MARIEGKKAENIKGLVGQVVFTEWKGIPIVKSKPKTQKKPRTEKQLFQQEKMRVVMQFIKPFKVLIDNYFGEPEGVKTRNNMATSYYLQQGLLIENQNISIDTNKVILTKGGLRGIEEATLKKVNPE